MDWTDPNAYVTALENLWTGQGEQSRRSAQRYAAMPTSASAEMQKLEDAQRDKTNAQGSGTRQYTTRPNEGALGPALWESLAKAGANPDSIGQIAALTYGHNLIGDNFAIQDLLKRAFTPDNYKGGGMRIPQGGQSTGTAHGSMSMAATPVPTHQSQAQLDLADWFDRRRQNAHRADEYAYRQKLLNSLGLQFGNMPSQLHSTEQTGQVFNMGGAPTVVPITTTTTRDVTPEERASYLSHLMGLLG